MLLEEGGKEVEGHDDVLSEFLIIHGLVSDGDVEVGNLLQLPLDGSLNIVDLLLNWLVVSHWLREHTNSVKNWTEDNWDLLDEGIGGEKDGVLLGPLLDLLLVLVELLKGVHVGNINTDLVLLDLIGVLLIANDADLEVWSWDVRESDGSNESLILLWIVILKGNLELDSLLELSLLGLSSHILDAFKDQGVGNLGHCFFLFNND